jgi:DNA-binding LacI/PurR family transcriptional regulator
MLAAFEQWLARPDRPTAILCSDGGRVLLAAAWKLGLQVPRDLSVVTFDNEAAAGSRIAIDRMLVRYRSLGRAAVEALTQRLDDPDASHDPRPARLIPFEFHQVGTVAGPSPPA